MDLSVVLPCYRAGNVLPHSVQELRRVLDAQSRLSWEIIAVDDGGGDIDTAQIPLDDRVRLISFPSNRGKGAAVASGMLAASGKIRIFTDVDLPYDPALIFVIAEYIERGFHVVIGDRTLPSSIYRKSLTLKRRVVSNISANIIGRLVTGGFFDTQCGLKGIRGDISDLIFPMMRINGFTFDVELLYIALRYRLDIKRIPVQLRSSGMSSVHVVADSAAAAKDLLFIKYLQMIGAYKCSEIEAITQDEFRADLAQVAAARQRQR